MAEHDSLLRAQTCAKTRGLNHKLKCNDGFPFNNFEGQVIFDPV